MQANFPILRSTGSNLNYMGKGFCFWFEGFVLPLKLDSYGAVSMPTPPSFPKPPCNASNLKSLAKIVDITYKGVRSYVLGRLKCQCARGSEEGTKQSGKSAHVRNDEGENQGHGSGSRLDLESDQETSWRWKEGQEESRQKARSAPWVSISSIKQHGKPARKRSGYARWEESDFDLNALHLRGLKIIKGKMHSQALGGGRGKLI